MIETRIKLLVIRSGDIEKTVAFYSKLGLNFEEEQHGEGPIHFAAEVGEMIFEIYPAKIEDDINNTTRLGFSVGNVDGIEFKDSPWGKRAVIKDPDGRSVELYNIET